MIQPPSLATPNCRARIGSSLARRASVVLAAGELEFEELGQLEGHIGILPHRSLDEYPGDLDDLASREGLDPCQPGRLPSWHRDPDHFPRSRQTQDRFTRLGADHGELSDSLENEIERAAVVAFSTDEIPGLVAPVGR